MLTRKARKDHFMIKSSKLALYNQATDCQSSIWNRFLPIQTNRLEKNEKPFSYSDECRELTVLKPDSDFAFLNEVSSQSLQQTSHDLDRALKETFVQKQPLKFKKEYHDTFRYPQEFHSYGSVQEESKSIYDFKEKYPSQALALQTLMKLGYTYIPTSKSMLSSKKKFLLNVLKKQLIKLNLITYKKKQYSLSQENVTLAIEKLHAFFKSPSLNSNETIYDLITQSHPLTQTIEESIQNFNLIYLDCKNWNNNVYHCTCETFSKGKSRKDPGDILLFINGIPLAVLPCTPPENGSPYHEFKAVSSENLSSYVRLLFPSNKHQGKNLILHAFTNINLLLEELIDKNEKIDDVENENQMLKACEETVPYVDDPSKKT